MMKGVILIEHSITNVETVRVKISRDDIAKLFGYPGFSVTSTFVTDENMFEFTLVKSEPVMAHTHNE